MPIPVVCPSCAAKLCAPNNLAGRNTKCPKCGTAIIVHKASELVRAELLPQPIETVEPRAVPPKPPAGPARPPAEDSFDFSPSSSKPVRNGSRVGLSIGLGTDGLVMILGTIAATLLATGFFSSAKPSQQQLAQTLNANQNGLPASEREVAPDPNSSEFKPPSEPARELDLEEHAERQAEIAKEYYTERNQRFLAILRFEKDHYDKYGGSTPFLLRMKVEDGPQPLTFSERRYTLDMRPNRAGYTRGMKVIQIIDNSKLLVAIGSSTAMAVGWDTTRLVDGDTIMPQDAIVVSGAIDYLAVSGARKRVYVVEPFDLIRYANDYRPQIPQSILDAVGQDVIVGDGLPNH